VKVYTGSDKGRRTGGRRYESSLWSAYLTICTMGVGWASGGSRSHLRRHVIGR